MITSSSTGAITSSSLEQDVKQVIARNRVEKINSENDLMIIKKSGVAIRLGVENMRVMGRATQGVRLITLKDNENIAAVTKVNKDEDEPDENVEINSESSTETTTEPNQEI